MITITKIIEHKINIAISFMFVCMLFFMLLLAVMNCIFLDYCYNITNTYSDTIACISSNNPVNSKNIGKYIFIPVEITSANPVPEQTDDTPFITASGKVVKEGYCALSPDIEAMYNYKFGDEVIILGYGIFPFECRTNKKLSRTVDIYLYDKKKSLDFGRQNGIIILSNKSIKRKAIL